MAESKLDIILDPKRAIEGARQVGQALGRISREAQTMTEHLHRRFDMVKNTIFSLQSALLALGVGAFAKSLIDVSRNLEMAERGLRTVTTSSGQAAVQLERIRKIADEFMFHDLPMANAFRLLASHGIPDTEKALRTLGNVALATGEDIEMVTIAMLAGHERQLRRLGVRVVELGQGQVDLIFGNMEIRANKTDAAIRKGLLQLFEKGFPDQTKKMGDSLDFQFKRIEDAWEDFRIAVMRSGLESWLTAVLGKIADGFNDDEMAEKGKKVGDAIQQVIKTIAKDMAFVIDLVTPLGKVLFEVLGGALKVFNELPPSVQALGIFGTMMFGLRGFAAITAGLYLADKLGIKANDIAKGVGEAADASMNFAAGSPIGFLLKKGSEALTGKTLDTRPKELPEETLYIGLGERIKNIMGDMDASKDKAKSVSQAVDDFFRDTDKRAADIQAKRKAAEDQANAERAKGATGTAGLTGMTDEQRVQAAQMEKLRAETEKFVTVEEGKRNRLFDPDKAAAMAKSVEFINSLKEKTGELDAASIKLIEQYFAKQGEAVAQTRIWNEVESERLERIQATNTLLSKATVELQEAADASKAMDVPIDERELETALLTLQREIMQGKVFLDQQEKGELIVKLTLMDVELKKVREKQAVEAQSLSTMSEILRLTGETRDMQNGITVASRESRMEQALAQAAAETKAPLTDPAKAQIMANVDKTIAAERANALARVNNEMDQEIDNQRVLASVTGKTKDAREEELRVMQKVLELKRKGIELTDEEIAKIKEESREIQEGIKKDRTNDAINSFVDQFQVGWDTIIKGGEQAYSHLEDAMTQWIMTGKLDMTSFANFVSQELIRMGIRASLMQLAGSMSGGGGAGIMSLVGSFFGGGAGGGTGTAASSAGASDLSGSMSSFAQRGGVFDAQGRIPGFQRGGINTHQRMIKISEGHTPEAVIPLEGGKVPVKMTGGRGVSINAPITIVTPDAAGVRRSEMQIQAQMSSQLLRASRRIN